MLLPISRVDHTNFLVPKVLRSPCGKRVRPSHPVYLENSARGTGEPEKLEKCPGGDKALKGIGSKHEVSYKVVNS